MKKMILIAALTLVLAAAAVLGVAASFAENAGVNACFFWGIFTSATKSLCRNAFCINRQSISPYAFD